MIVFRQPLDVSAFFKNEQFCDIEVRSKAEHEDPKIFQCHRIILSASSPFFQNYLSEKNDGTIIVPLTAQQLEHALQFIYLGQTTMDITGIPSFMDTLKFLGMETFGGDAEASEGVDPTASGDGEDDPNLPGTSKSCPPKKRVKRDPDAKQNDEGEQKPDVKPNLAPVSMCDIDDEKIKKLVKVDSSGSPYCVLCNRGFKSKQMALDHIRALHIGEKNIQCFYCPAMFKSKGHRSVHISQRHREQHKLNSALQS